MSARIARFSAGRQLCQHRGDVSLADSAMLESFAGGRLFDEQEGY
jgi:hypothetical protein